MQKRSALLCIFLATSAPVIGLVSGISPYSQQQGRSISTSDGLNIRQRAAVTKNANMDDGAVHRSRIVLQTPTNSTACSASGFLLVEATIAKAHAALLGGYLTCSDLVQVSRL